MTTKHTPKLRVVKLDDGTDWLTDCKDFGIRLDAAPDLLAALEGMLQKDAAMAEHFGHKWPTDLDAKAEQARAAIAKAKGEA